MNRKIFLILAAILIVISPVFALNNENECKYPSSRLDHEAIDAIIGYYKVREANHKIFYELFFTYFKMREESKKHEIGQKEIDYYLGEFEKAVEAYLDQSTNKEIAEAWENQDIEGYINGVGKKIVENIPIVGDVYNTLGFLKTTTDIYAAAKDAPNQIMGIVEDFTTMQFHEVYVADSTHYLDVGYFIRHLTSTRDHMEKYPGDAYKLKQRWEEELVKLGSLEALTNNAIGEPDVWEKTSFEEVTNKLYQYQDMLAKEKEDITKFLKTFVPPEVEFDEFSYSLFYPELQTLNLTAWGYEFEDYLTPKADSYIWGYRDPTFGWIAFPNENSNVITLKKDYPIIWNFDRDYKIWVTAVTQEGICSSRKEHQITVKQVIPNNPLMAEPTTGQIPLKVKFTSKVQGDYYRWFIGDVTDSEHQGADKQSIEHMFYGPGIYNIELKIESGDEVYDFSTAIELIKRKSPAMLNAKFDKSEVIKGELASLKIDISFIPNDAGTPAPSIETIKYDCNLDGVSVGHNTYADYDKNKLANNIKIPINTGVINTGEYKCTVTLKTKEDAYNSAGDFSVTTPVLKIKPNIAAPAISIRAKSATNAGFSVEGEAPFLVEFEELKVMKIAGIKKAEFDKDGNGIFEFKREFTPARQYQYDLIAEEGPQSYTFNNPGIYRPGLKGTDENGLIGERYITVTVTAAASTENASKTYNQNEDDKCTDSDNGKNYYVEGTTESEDPEIGTNIIDDFCQVGNVLVEGYCKDGEATSVTYTCQYGCENGVCLQQSVDTTISCDECCINEGYNGGKCDDGCSSFDGSCKDADQFCQVEEGLTNCCCYYSQDEEGGQDGSRMTQQECAEYTSALGYEHSMIDTNCAEYANAYCQNSVGHSQSVVYQEQNCCIWNC